MERAYLVITLHEDNFGGSENISIDLFTNKEDAVKRIDDYSDAQVSIEKGEITRQFGTYCGAEFVPEKVYKFWPTGKVIYGKTVRSEFMREFCYTYRFLIEKDFEKKS